MAQGLWCSKPQKNNKTINRPDYEQFHVGTISSPEAWGDQPSLASIIFCISALKAERMRCSLIKQKIVPTWNCSRWGLWTAGVTRSWFLWCFFFWHFEQQAGRRPVPSYLRGAGHSQQNTHMDELHYRWEEKSFFFFYFAVNCPFSNRLWREDGLCSINLLISNISFSSFSCMTTSPVYK